MVQRSIKGNDIIPLIHTCFRLAIAGMNVIVVFMLGALMIALLFSCYYRLMICWLMLIIYMMQMN